MKNAKGTGENTPQHKFLVTALGFLMGHDNQSVVQQGGGRPDGSELIADFDATNSSMYRVHEARTTPGRASTVN